MSITREQVADLREGDVVEYGNASYGWTITGALWENPDGALLVGNCVVRHPDGYPPSLLSRTLTVVSRAPRPLYVNHPRTEPAYGDVARDADDDSDTSTWVCLPNYEGAAGLWVAVTSKEEIVTARRVHLPDRLRLLVDGELGQVVP